MIVESNKIEIEWEYEYYEDTDEIPTAEESEKGYNPPEYFFRVKIGKVFADSGLLEFKDWIEIELKDNEGNSFPNKDFILHLADGSEKRGTLDSDGYAMIDDVPPGRVTVEFPNLTSDKDE